MSVQYTRRDARIISSRQNEITAVQMKRDLTCKS